MLPHPLDCHGVFLASKSFTPVLLNYKQLNSEFYLRQFPKAIVVSAKVTKEIVGPLQFTVIQEA